MQLRRKTTIIIGALMAFLFISFDAMGATTYPAGTNVPNTFFFTNTFRSNTVFQSTLQLNEMTRPSVSSSNTIYMWVEDMAGLPVLRVRDWKGLVLGVVRDNIWIGRCATPGGILKGDAVYCAGTANSNMVWIGKAKADSRTTMPSVGLATENIAFLAAGRILNNGLLPEVDTTNWNTGDILYVSDSVAGGLTNVIPVVPSLMQQIGFVQVPNTNGSIQVEMGSLLNDATGTGQTNWYFGPYTTNILSYGGSKINGVGLTNGVVSGDGSGLTNVQGSNIVGTITVSQLNVGTLILTNPPALDLSSSTNFNASGLFYKTNVSTAAPNFFLPYSIFATNAAFAFLAPLNVSATNAQTAVVMVTNSTGSSVVVTAPANVHIQGTWNVTNVSTFTFFNYGGTFTNAIAFPLW